MKYQILVEKENDVYTACCPALPRLRVTDRDMNAMLARLRSEFLCYVHDTNAELDIVLDRHEHKTDSSQRPSVPLA